jgi:glycosyltransferase involved in cell wall biosynthesis
MADKIIAISEQTRSDLISFINADPGKIEVIYQGCDPVFYEKVSEEIKDLIRQRYHIPDNFILYVGTIEERKNLLQIIKARYEYDIKLPLVAIGRYTPYMDEIRKYINEKKITGIIFPGQVSLTDLPAIYQMSSVFIYPSSFEGFGIPVLEALNSGIPVIAAKGSSLEETGGLNSIYINPEIPGEIAHSLQRLLTDEPLRKKMIREGYKHALNFREDKSIRKIMELYQKLL